MFKVKTELEKDNFAKFVLEPLEAGFGHTMGNSLRRVLLTALEGFAITSVKIDGAAHQFSTIEGVTEDVIEILLNLKKVRVKIFGDQPIKLKLQISGKREVLAKDIEVIGDGEIVSPNQHIATLGSPKAKLYIDMVAERGKGYMNADEKKLGEIGLIPTDAIFTPVISVNYTVEPIRVGRRTDFDKLLLDVTTDGSLTPLEALNQASKILSETFKQVFEPSVDEVDPSLVQSVVSDEILKMTIEELDLPVRITNALRTIEVNTVGDLINIRKQQLLKAKNLGAKSLSLITEKLSERGLSLSEA